MRFHIHPSVKASKLLSENVLLKTTSGLAWIFKSNSAGLKIEDSIFETRLIDKVAVKGKVKPITVHEVLNERLEA